jgi:hypothetical protein
MISFLRESGTLSRASMDLESPKPYELAITTTADSQHYQITLRAMTDMKDKSTWCWPAAFSDDRGVIFLVTALGCEEQGKQDARLGCSPRSEARAVERHAEAVLECIESHSPPELRRRIRMFPPSPLCSKNASASGHAS